MREMSEPEEQGGREKREAHQKKIDDAWDEIASGSETINFDQFKALCDKINEIYVELGQKGREYTEGEWNMLWAAFNGYNGGNGNNRYEGITKDDFYYVTEHATY